MALREEVVLDIQSAQRQIDALERQLDQLGTPVDVPVNISGEQSIDRLRRDFAQADDSVEALNRELRETDDELRRAERAADNTGDAMLRVGTRGVSAFSNLRGSIIGVGAAFVAFQGARAFLDFAGESVQAASDLEESTSKAQVVFGEFADEIEAFSQTAPQALGLANAQALEFTGTFGNLFVALGLSQQAATELAPEIVQLGADLASFNNIDVTEALDKLRAGLVGEAEPLRTLGVNLTAAATAAKAVELGLADSTTTVSEAAKVQARYALILEQTVTAQGDFARTADGIANRQRTLTAEMENFRAEIGQALLPAMEALLNIAPELVDALRNGLVPAFQQLSLAIASVDTEGIGRNLAGLPAALGSVFSQIGAGAQATGNALQVFGALARFDFGDVGDQFAQLGDDIDRFRSAPAANQAIQNLLTTLAGGAEPVAALEAVLADLGQNVSTLTLDAFEDLVETMLLLAQSSGALPSELSALADVVEVMGEQAGFSSAGVELLVEALRLPGLTALAEGSVGDIIVGNLQAIGDAAGSAEAPVRGFTEALQDFEAPDFSAQFDALEAQFAGLPDELSAVGDALRDEENEIVTDFTEFLGNLEDELAARQQFADNIEILRNLGLGDLADAFTEQGLEAAGALADAVANPEEAARAEAALDAFAEAQAVSFRQALTEAIQASPLDLTIPLNVVGAIQSLQLQGLPGQDAAQAVGAAGGGPNVGGGVTVNQTFENTPGPNTETERAAQQINALINVS